jgi:hypothetical protein
MTTKDYWIESMSEAAEECELTLTKEQLECLAYNAQMCHENYGMAFYSPPSSERYEDIEREWKAKLKAKEKELEQYRTNAETAVKRALRQHSDANVSIGEYGEVTRYDGRATQIQ